MNKIFLSLLIIYPLAFSGPLFSGSVHERKEALSMDGYTHYGLPIEEIRRLIRYDEFAGEIIYSPELSDSDAGEYMKIFFDEFARHAQQIISRRDSEPEFTLTVKISSCRFGKTGYCGRVKRTDVLITAYVNGKKYRERPLSHEDIIHPEKSPEKAQSAALYLLGDL